MNWYTWCLLTLSLAVVVFFASLFFSRKSKLYSCFWLPPFLFASAGTFLLSTIFYMTTPPGPGGGGEGLLQIIIGTPSLICLIPLLIRHPPITFHSFKMGALGCMIFFALCLSIGTSIDIIFRAITRETIYFMPMNKAGSSVINDTEVSCRFPHHPEESLTIEKDKHHYKVYSRSNYLLECIFSLRNSVHPFHKVYLSRSAKYIQKRRVTVRVSHSKGYNSSGRNFSRKIMEKGKIEIQVFPGSYADDEVYEITN